MTVKDFLAKLGYTLMWGLGIPKYSLEEKFEEYYKVGLIFIIIVITSLTILTMLLFYNLLLYYLKKDKEN